MPTKERYARYKREGKCVNCGGYRDAKALKCSTCSTSNSLGVLGRAGIKGTAEGEVARLLAEDRQKAMASAAKLDMAKALRQRTTVNIIRDAIISSTSYIDLTAAPAPAPYKAGKGSPETQVALLGDIQYGRVTPSFNTGVAQRRLRYYARKIIRIGDLHRNAYPIDDIVVMGLGDMVDNEVLFPTQPHMVEIPVFQQVSELAQHVGDFLLDLAEEYKRVSFVGIPGNHGRVSRFNNPVSNWDNMFYLVLKAALRTHSRIKIQIPETMYDWYKVVRVRGHGFLLIHGDQIRAWMNYPWYGSTQKAMRWTGSIPEPWEYMIHGHFHTQNLGYDFNDLEIISNGTFLSGDEYALRELGYKSSVKQITFGVNEHHGKTWTYGIKLDEDDK